MKVFRFSASVLAITLGAAGSAQADLLGVTQTFPDISLSTSYLIYDHNGVDANTGLLRVVANASTLNEGMAAGNSTLTQSYLGPGDSTPDVMLSFQIRNGNGGFALGSFAGGNVSIGYGTSPANTSKFSWQGAITAFGFQADGRAFDAAWSVAADQYLNMPASLGQFVGGLLTGGAGGIKISNSAGFGAANFGNDWVFATNANSPTINSYLGGLTTPLKINSTVLVDTFATPVPESDTFLLMTVGLAVIAQIARRRKALKCTSGNCA
ncbi:MAG: hypothetical protein FD134_918 [Gallionellaceae bacterium]|nr:MAG: hypothetical protein FD134_918 [Gallionellaceae bacterium]